MGVLTYKFFGHLLKNSLSAQTETLNNLNFLKPRLLHLSSRDSLKWNIPIKWVRPEKIPCILPAKSGDLKPLEKLDTKQLAPEFKDLDEIKSADENVKKLFSLEFQRYKSSVEVLREEYISRVRRHKYDTNSPEVRIAKMTANIRDMQKYVENFPHDKRTKVRLKETIDKRKKLLKLLRSWDYKCFEYVIEKLDLVYKPFPPHDVYKRIERKRSLRMLTDKYCENMVSDKLKTYMEELASKKENFFVEKIETLKWILKEENRYGVQPTVTADDIATAEEELRKLRESKKIKKAVDVND